MLAHPPPHHFQILLKEGAAGCFSPLAALHSLKPALAPYCQQGLKLSCILPFQVSVPHPVALTGLCSKYTCLPSRLLASLSPLTPISEPELTDPIASSKV